MSQKNFAWLAACCEDLVEDVTYNILPTFKNCYNHQTLNVGILTIPDYFIMQTIKEVLKQFGFVRIHFTNFDDPNIDFFISTFDTLLPDNLEKPIFIVELIENSGYEKELFAELWQAYRQKILRTSRTQEKTYQQFPPLSQNNKMSSEDFDSTN